MINYIIRRVLYAIPILIVINCLTFFLFFFVNSPDDVAHMVVGMKQDSVERIYTWKREHNYHLPRFFNRRDAIVYITAADAVPGDLAQALDGYTVDLRNFNPAALEKARQALAETRAALPAVQQGAEPTAADAADALVREVRAQMHGNEIVLVDPAGIDNELARTIKALLESGEPFIVLDQPGTDISPEFDRTVIVRRIVSTEQTAAQLAELRSYIDALQARGAGVITQTLFFEKSVRLFWFDFGKSDRDNRDISRQVLKRMVPSLLVTVPAFILGIFLDIFIAMIVAYTRGTYVDRSMAVVCILIMSVLSLFYYFSAQLVFGAWLRIFPVSGFLHGWSAIRFVLLPVVISVFMGIGGGVRFYRTIFLEEINRDYVRTARSKGLSEIIILYKHVLKNAMIPILTNAVLAMTGLFMGSLILEQFFGIPGLGNFTLEGIQSQDFRVVGSMVYLGSFLYIVGLIATDISYTLVDPRVRFE